jgi:hypothetical protein
VPRRATKLTVGGGAKSQVFLERDDVSNRVVFDLAKSLRVDGAVSEAASGR